MTLVMSHRKIGYVASIRGNMLTTNIIICKYYGYVASVVLVMLLRCWSSRIVNKNILNRASCIVTINYYV